MFLMNEYLRVEDGERKDVADRERYEKFNIKN